MAQFALVYFGGDKPSSPEEGQKHFAKYQEWMQSLGDALVSPMNPFKDTHTIKPDGTVVEVGQSTMSGYSILEAESMEKALEMVHNCPFLEMNGTLEISEIVQM